MKTEIYHVVITMVIHGNAIVWCQFYEQLTVSSSDVFLLAVRILGSRVLCEALESEFSKGHA